MSLGTITVTNDLHGAASAPLQFLELSFLGDSSYPAGGSVGFTALVQAKAGRAVTPLFVVKCATTGVYTPIYDKANDKLYVLKADQTEVTASTDLSGTTFKVIVACF
jgi:hypothetical protein